MTTKYTIHSRPSIVGGILAASGATALLVRDGFDTGFGLDHMLMPVLVGMTILSAHLAIQAAHEWRPAAIGLAFLALFGSGLTIYETMGRRAETRDTKMMAAQANEARRLHLSSELQDAKTTLQWAEKDRAAECAGAPSPVPNTWPECRRKTGTVNALKAQIANNTSELDRLRPMPVDPKGERIAGLAGFFGADVTATKAAVAMFEPFLLPLFLELGSIIMFGFGVGHLAVTPAAPPEPDWKDEDLMPAPEEDDKVLSYVKAFEAKNGRKPQIPEVQAMFPDVSRSTVHRRIRAA